MKISEIWSGSERRKRSKKCDNPRGFTMRQFCKNQKTRSKPTQRANESILRQLIREELESDIEEAHAGGLGFAYEKGNEPESDDSEPQDDEEWQRHVQDRARGAQRYARSGRFKKLAEKHYANLPFPVWTAPYIGNLDDISTVVDSSRSCYRMNVMDLRADGKTFLRSHGYRTDDVGDNDLVILYTAGVANAAVMATPWMIIHAIFDSAQCADLLTPGYSWIADALAAGKGYTEGGGYDSRTFLKSIAGDYAVDWQGYLTMRSARNREVNSPSDAMAEMMCQELLTTGGLKFDFEGMDENDPVRKDLIWLGKQVKSKAAEFRKSARGKLIAVAVNQGDV